MNKELTTIVRVLLEGLQREGREELYKVPSVEYDEATKDDAALERVIGILRRGEG